MILDIVYILLGLALLVKGGDYLVDGSVAIAKRARLSEMVIGLTVVGFGTSMPELLVSAQSALMGNSGIAIGNVVGSNIANIALILGVTSIIHVIPAQKITLKIDLPFMLLSLVLFVAIAMTGYVGRVAGVIGVLMLICFVSYQVRQSRKAEAALAKENPEAHDEAEPMALWKAMLLVIVSFLAMVFGANILVEGASNIARLLGVTDRVIGLTIVAIGTSLPELFSSVMAAVKGKTDMAIGNIIGSVTFNILCVIGVSSIITPIMATNIGFAFDYALMVILGVMLWLFLRTKHELERWEGVVLTIIFIAYLAKTVVIG
jgi:cation:H+ antiporter